jgi:acetyl esterase/lipase/esterase/lipase superfamily enzyme
MKQLMLATCVLALTGIPGYSQRGAPNEGQPQAGPSLKIDRDLEYARPDGRALKLDLYRRVPQTAPSAVVLWIHGVDSSLAGKAPTPAAALATQGYAVVSIDYRTGTGVTAAAQVADAKAAVRWLRAHAGTYSLDAAHVGAFGHDVGAQIAALLGAAGDVPALEGDGGNPDQSSRVQAVVDLAGPVDRNRPVNPLAYVTKDDPPFLILHGTADDKVATLQSQALVSALKVAGVNAALELQIGVSHDLGQLLSPLAMQLVADFFDQHLRGRPREAALSNYLSTPLDQYVDPVALDLGGTLYRTYPTPVRGPGTYASYRVYLPPDYDTNRTRRYPVVYFLHGSMVDSKRPITSGYIARADAAIRSGVMPPAIIILPQGLNQGRWIDARDGTAPMESVIIKNLIPHVDATYRTIARREGRAIEGHSMGGFGALHNGFNNPDLFAAVTGNSPGGATLDPGGNAPPAGRIDAFKVVYGSDRDYFTAMAPTALAEKNAAKLRQQSIRIICGTEDSLFAGSQFVHEALVKLGIPHEFIPVPGSPHNHDQLLAFMTFDPFAFYGKVFGRLNAAPAKK